MKSTLLQIAGIINYEMRMQWRRRTMLIIFSIFLFGLVILQFPTLPNGEGLPGIAGRLPMAVLILLGVVSAITSEIIPIDRQLHVYDLLHTLPMSKLTYMTGKVLSVWFGLMIGSVLIATGLGIAIAASGEFEDVSAYISLWLVQMPHILLAGSAPVLAASMLSTRREAALLSLLIAPYLLVRYIFAVLQLPTPIDGLYGLVGHLIIISLVVWLITKSQESRA